jgi:hypothetical protein
MCKCTWSRSMPTSINSMSGLYLRSCPKAGRSHWLTPFVKIFRRYFAREDNVILGLINGMGRFAQFQNTETSLHETTRRCRKMLSPPALTNGNLPLE